MTSNLASPALGFLICFGVPVGVVAATIWAYRSTKDEHRAIASDLRYTRRGRINRFMWEVFYRGR